MDENSEKAVEDTKDNDYFFSQLCKGLHYNIPTYIINILKLTGYDSPVVLGNVTMEDIAVMESFVRSNLEALLPDNYNAYDYYGSYGNNKTAFQFVPGHLKLIFELKAFINKKSPQNFKRTEASKHKQNFVNGQSSSSQNTCVEAEICGKIPEPENNSTKISQLVTIWLQKNVPTSLKTKFDFTNLFIIVNEESAKIKCPLCENHFINIVSSQLKTERRWIISNFVRHIKKVHLERMAEAKSFQIEASATDPIPYKTKQTSILDHINRRQENISKQPSLKPAEEPTRIIIHENILINPPERIKQQSEELSSDDEPLIKLRKSENLLGALA